MRDIKFIKRASPLNSFFPKNIRGITLVELLLAAAVAIFGVTFILLVAADVISAGAGVNSRNAETAQARVALMRLRSEITQAQTLSADINGITLKETSGKIHWQVVTFSGAPVLTRINATTNAGATPMQKNTVAINVSGVTLSNKTTAITLGITAGIGHRRMKLQDTIRQWGTTL